jgi:hypothetical protein
VNPIIVLAAGIGVYGSFFAPPAPKLATRPPVNWHVSTATPTTVPPVVCGMTLLPANPKGDRSMKRAAPDPKRFPMRTLEPQLCTR